MAETAEMDALDFSGTVTIAANAKLSSAFNLGGHLLKAIVIPSAFSGSTIKVKVATTDTSGEYVYAYKSGADVSYTVAASKSILVIDDKICDRWIKVESQTTEGSARTIRIVAMRLY